MEEGGRWFEWEWEWRKSYLIESNFLKHTFQVTFQLSTREGTLDNPASRIPTKVSIASATHPWAHTLSVNSRFKVQMAELGMRVFGA